MSDFTPTPMQNEAHPYQKLGGWLLFFVICNLFSMVNLFSRGSSGPWALLGFFTYVSGVEFVCLLAMLLLQLYKIAINITTAIMVIRRSPYFLRLEQLSWLGSILGQAVSLPILFSLQPQYPAGGNITLIIAFGAIPMTVVMIVVLMLYYAKSVRVRTYMGSDEYLRLAFFAKKIKGPEPAVPDAAEKTEIPVEEGDL